MERPKFVDKMMRRVPMFYGPAAMDEICAYIEALEKDAARWRYVHDEPESARHLIRLLLDGKGTPADLDKMVDRIVASKRAALAASDPPRRSEAQG